MMTLFKLPLFLRFSVRMLCCQLFFIAVIINSQTPFSPPDSIIFISEGAYLYSESPIYISGQTFKKESFKKPSKAIIKRSFSGSFDQKSINGPAENICYKSSPKSKHSLGLLFNSSSMAGIEPSPPVKLQQKTIRSSFILLSARRDKEKHIHITFYSFQLKHININYFGRPPPKLGHG